MTERSSNLKKNSSIFKWEYPTNYEFHRKINRYFCSPRQNQSKPLMLNEGKSFCGREVGTGQKFMKF